MSDENPKVSGDAMKNLRKNLGFTQEQWAEMRGLSARTVKREEAGASTPRDKGFLALASLIGGASGSSLALSASTPVLGSLLGLGSSLALGPLAPLLMGLAAFAGLALSKTGSEAGTTSQAGARSQGGARAQDGTGSQARAALQANPVEERMVQQLWEMREQMIMQLPIPRTIEERAKAEKVQLTVGVDRILFDKFQEEANVRGFTQSRLLESLLWLFLEMPQLSFQELGVSPKDLSPDENGPSTAQEETDEVG